MDGARQSAVRWLWSMGLSMFLGAGVAGGCLAQVATQEATALATQKALDALFTMESVLPEGYHQQIPPESFDPEGGEAALVAYLAQQKRSGADLNAYRNLGTPLHHAIRGGLHDTARWLLKNGADPLRPLQGTDGQGTTGVDALGVLIQTGQWELYGDLLRLPAYAALPAQDKARRYWPLVMTGQADDVAKVDELIERRFPIPDFTASGTVAEVLLRQGLCEGHHVLVAALLSSAAASRSFASVHQSLVPCTTWGTQRRPLSPLPVATWKALEERLQWPVLPYLVSHAQTADEARQWLNSGLRSPWGEPQAAALYGREALRAAPPAAMALLRAMPAPLLAQQTQDVPWTRQWLRQAANWPLADLQWALSSIGTRWLSAHRQAVMGDWSYTTLTRREAKDAADRQARWSMLTDHLRFDDGASEQGDDGFFYRVPSALWPRWFAQGYRQTAAQWAQWIEYTDLEPLQQAWPLVSKYQPDVAARALTWLVAPLSVGPSEDAQARTLGYRGGYFSEQEWLRKTQFLQSQGLRVPQPRWLAAQFRSQDPSALSPAVALALQNDWVREPPAALRQQIERVPLACAVRPSEALRRSLAAGGPAASMAPSDLSIQPLAVPGQAECGWLMSAQTSGGRVSVKDESFGSVQTMRPCTEAQAAGWSWNEQSQGWAEVAEMPVGILWVARWKPRGESFVVSMGQSLGTCGQAPGGIYQMAFAQHGALTLTSLESGHPAYDALVLQCSLGSMETCFGFNLDQPPTDPADSRSLADFAATAWPQAREAFFSAIDQMDRPALAQLREQGLFSAWLTEAVQRVDASTAWSLDQKRQRMAWLQGQGRYQLRPDWSDLELLTRLAAWLPPQDWGPIASSLRCTDRRYLLQQLADNAEVAQKQPRLPQRLRAALASACSAP